MRPSANGRGRGAVIVAVAVLSLAVGAALGLVTGSRVSPEPPVQQLPGPASVDAGFAWDMKAHHAQAVQMSTLVRDRTTDPEVRTLALDIALTQQQQIGQMYAWLAHWDLPQSAPGPGTEWMAAGGSSTPGRQHGAGHGGPESTAGSAGSMPGMATDVQLDRLRRARGQDAERLYLQLMIPHHQGGVAMAELALRQATQPQVRLLAQAIVDSQTGEIAALRDMLAARGGQLPAA